MTSTQLGRKPTALMLRPALPVSKVDQSVLATEMFNKSVSAPFFINA